MAIEKLSEDDEDKALDMILNLEPVDKIAKKLGFKSRSAFAKYSVANPDFMERCDRARAMSCVFLEDEMLSAADNYDKNLARTRLEAISRLLKYRDPKKYGDKLDMSVVHTVDISGSLDRANNRVLDVIPVNVIPLLSKT